MGRLSGWAKYGIRLGLPVPRHLTLSYLDWAFLRDTLDAFEIDCVLDVGANVGQFAESLRRIGYRGWICSFEPVDEAYSSLHAAHGDDPHWLGYNYALGSQDERRILHVGAQESSAMSSFHTPRFDNEFRQVEIEVKRLDGVLDEVITATSLSAPRVFLKMDTQGHDLEVIAGSTGCIDRILGLQSELSVEPLYEGVPHYLDALGSYEDLGFRLHRLEELWRDEQSLALIEMDCIMMKPPVYTNDPAARWRR